MSEETGILFWLGIFRKNMKLIVGASLGAGVLTLIVVLFLPRVYEARTSILPPHENPVRISPREKDITAALRLQTLVPFSDRVTLAEVYMAILESDNVARRLVERFDLKAHYKTKTMVKTLQALRSHFTLTPTIRRIIEIRVEDKDPQLAADLANAFVEELDHVFRETRSSAGRRQRHFLEKRLNQARAELDSADAALARAQQAEGITAISHDLTEAAVAAGELLGQKLALSVQIQMLEAMSTNSSPARRQLELELSAVEKEIARLPFLGLEVARCLRDLKIQETLYESLIEHYEVARIEEARDTPSVEVLDLALPPDRHKRPRRGLSAMAGTVAGFVFALTWIGLREVRT